MRHDQHECDTSVTLAIRVRHERHHCHTSATRMLHEPHECNTSKNISLHPHIYYTASERLQVEEQFHSKNYLLEMPCFHAKMRLKSAPQKLDFLMTKALLRSRIVTHSNPASISIRTILCENTNILFSKNY